MQVRSMSVLASSRQHYPLHRHVNVAVRQNSKAQDCVTKTIRDPFTTQFTPVPRGTIAYLAASFRHIDACARGEIPIAKCAKIFQEKISGARSDRKQLTRLMGVLAKGDVLVVTRLDRLARSTRDLLNLLGTIAEKGAGFKSLRDTWADTTTAHGRLMLTVLGGLAEFERELIRTRTGEGRERAKARGVILGRKPKLTSHQRREAIARREAGEVLTEIARSYNVSHSTISRLN